MFLFFISFHCSQPFYSPLALPLLRRHWKMFTSVEKNTTASMFYSKSLILQLKSCVVQNMNGIPSFATMSRAAKRNGIFLGEINKHLVVQPRQILESNNCCEEILWP